MNQLSDTINTFCVNRKNLWNWPKAVLTSFELDEWNTLKYIAYYTIQYIYIYIGIDRQVENDGFSNTT